MRTTSVARWVSEAKKPWAWRFGKRCLPKREFWKSGLPHAQNDTRRRRARSDNPKVMWFKSHLRNHIVKPKKISWLRTPEISRFRGFFSRLLAFSQPWGLRIQSAEKKISFQKNGFGQDLNPAVPVFKGRKCDDFTHLLPFFRIFIC